MHSFFLYFFCMCLSQCHHRLLLIWAQQPAFGAFMSGSYVGNWPLVVPLPNTFTLLSDSLIAAAAAAAASFRIAVSADLCMRVDMVEHKKAGRGYCPPQFWQCQQLP